MRFCQAHWDLCKMAIEERGMSGLVSYSGEERADRFARMAEGAPPEDTFDPLAALHVHFTLGALDNGGLYIMGQNETGENDGHYCPICEFVKHAKDFAPAHEVGRIADQMQEWAREHNLIPKLQ